MKFLKEKRGIIISFIIGVIIASSITVYAYSYFASDITYTKGSKNIKVSDALDELYIKSQNFINADNLELIGVNLGTDFTVPIGYKYVAICNGWYTTGGTDYTNRSKLNNISNATLLLEKDTSKINGNNGAGSWLLILKITDTTKASTYSVGDATDFNIVFGIK